MLKRIDFYQAERKIAWVVQTLLRKPDPLFSNLHFTFGTSNIHVVFLKCSLNQTSV